MKAFTLARRSSVRCSYVRSSSATKSSPDATAMHSVKVRGTIPTDGIGIKVDQYAETERLYTVPDIQQFASLVGDMNPLHQPWEGIDSLPGSLVRHPLIPTKLSTSHGSTPPVLVPGMLVASIFSSIIGTLIPGAVYLQQSLHFQKPVYANDVPVVGRITITRIRQWKRKGLIMTCNTTVCCGDEEAIRGQADVWLPKSSVFLK